MRIEAVPCLSDNYAWWMPEIGVIVDPSEAAPVLAAIGENPLQAVWLTHHHWDHVGGVLELTERFPGLRVFASRYDRDRIDGVTDVLGEGDEVGPARILEVPGHTLGAIAYVLDDAVFTGDTLFGAGCGRLFEGTPEQMVASLGKLRALPDTTRVCCGHEYTEKNLRFTRSVDAESTREPGPLTIGEERRTNVFLRWDDPRLIAQHGVEGVALFAKLRELRNQF